MTTVQPALVRPMMRSHQPDVSDLRLLAALLGLIFLAVPVANGASPAAGDAMAAGAALFAVIPILTRVSRASGIATAILLLSLAYLLSTLFSDTDRAEALRHTITTASTGAVLLLFATYGKEMVAYRWFRGWAYILVTAGVVAVNFSGLPKNITGGSTVYLVAFGISLLIVGQPRRTWFYAGAFFVATATLAFVLNFRGLVALTLILMLAYWGSLVLSRRAFAWAGVLGAVGAIWAVVWFFLNIRTNALAATISNRVAELSGHRTTSGRDWLWPSINHYVGSHRWFGRGAGELPRDFLPTNLSSHSYYMQAYLQLGLLGLSIVVVVLLAVWKVLARPTDESGRFAAALFLMFVVHNASEVLMFENGLIAGIPAWCSIGLGLALVRARADQDGLAQRHGKDSSLATQGEPSAPALPRLPPVSANVGRGWVP